MLNLLRTYQGKKDELHSRFGNINNLSSVHLLFLHAVHPSPMW